MSLSTSCPCCPEDSLGSSLGVPSQIQGPMSSGGSLGHPGILPSSPSQQAAHAVRRIPWTSRDPPFMSLSHSCLEDPLDIMGFLGHPGILPSCPSHTTAPCCPEDPLDIPRSSLGVPSDTGPHGVWRVPWASWDPPYVSPQTQAPMLSGGPLGHPGILPWCPLRHRPPWCLCPLRHRPPWCPEDPLDIPGSSLGVPLDTGPHGVQRIPWTSRDPPYVSPQTQAPMLSGGSPGHPWILPWCPLRHRPPCCPEDPLDIPGSSLGVPSDTGSQAVRRIPWTSQDPRPANHSSSKLLRLGGLNIACCIS